MTIPFRSVTGYVFFPWVIFPHHSSTNPLTIPPEFCSFPAFCRIFSFWQCFFAILPPGFVLITKNGCPYRADAPAGSREFLPDFCSKTPNRQGQRLFGQICAILFYLEYSSCFPPLSCAGPETGSSGKLTCPRGSASFFFSV
ncbi:hypothetical protein D1841_04125 [Neglecta sp. X4]|nr:hypothetical protein [Neglectibacter sp. 59]NBJ72520.1 hypothetical protein [Neglectibacter sp. X4]NCE80447.1 hypothetical protein [Neglectibacter sp. X58]